MAMIHAGKCICSRKSAGRRGGAQDGEESIDMMKNVRELGGGSG